MRQPQIFLSVLLFWASLFSQSTFANDGVASIGVGGINLIKSNHVSMQKETLRISPHQIQVDYIFQNESVLDQKLLVAFPLPLLDFFDGEMGGLKERYANVEQPSQLLHFQLKIDEQIRSPNIEIKAFVTHWNQKKAKEERIDVTHQLRKLGLPLYPLDPKFAKALANLSAQQKATLVKQGILYSSTPETETPQWKVQIIFYWEQNFPAGKQVHIFHSYSPIMGAFYGDLGEQTQKEYCPDPAISHQIQALFNEYKDTFSATNINHTSVDYILQTAKTWHGPIGSFRLIVDKEEQNYVSLCAPGLEFKQITPTQFEATKENYIPSYDLHLLFTQLTLPRKKS